MKRVSLSVVVMLAVATLAVLGTYASFTDTERSTNNTCQAGILNLVLSDGDPSTLGDGVQSTWVMYMAFPHDSVSRAVQLTNFGTLGDFVDVEWVATNGWRVDPPPSRPLRPKDAVLMVTQMTYAEGTPDQETIVWVDSGWPTTSGSNYHFDPARVTDWNSDGLISLDDLEKQRIEFAPAPDSAPLQFRITIQFEPQFGPYPDNEYQDVETNMTVIFTLR